MLSALQNTAVQLLRPAMTPDPRNRIAPDDSPIAAARKMVDSGPLTGTEKPGVTQVKLKLFERLGEALGLKVEDYASLGSYARAVRGAIEATGQQEGGAAALQAIEQTLDLNKLGMTLDTLIGAMEEPEGEADRALEKALAEFLGVEPPKGKSGAGPFQTDALGLYGPAAGR
ncbi:hypothetical protein NS365_09805 [Aureimonas ureilytica]|uniref:Uncharacterized protein n=1 Tax=Aureimonas ureilytica TaxID=401562 RepID=A0A175RS86_9HYPH|nr:hypothetical protein [Aureimonas ureilytica]KTR05689.1 hypothetical protein NS365_09805 [Aureimonas ureilytica]